MTPTFEQADRVAETLVGHLEDFQWFQGVAVEKEQAGFFVSVRVAPAISVEDARAKSLIPFKKDGVEIRFRHEQMAEAFSLVG